MPKMHVVRLPQVNFSSGKIPLFIMQNGEFSSSWYFQVFTYVHLLDLYFCLHCCKILPRKFYANPLTDLGLWQVMQMSFWIDAMAPELPIPLFPPYRIIIVPPSISQLWGSASGSPWLQYFRLGIFHQSGSMAPLSPSILRRKALGGHEKGIVLGPIQVQRIFIDSGVETGQA